MDPGTVISFTALLVTVALGALAMSAPLYYFGVRLARSSTRGHVKILGYAALVLLACPCILALAYMLWFVVYWSFIRG